MYLKSLKLTGFKSFADRTRLELRPGVTVVVGPNGSGKSNIVDALAWVLGTQSPKSLRTSKMDDVIFAGTATRPGLSRAEVTLVLDNSSGALPLDLPEVSITRRLYRDGSSDYEINGVGCRLLDIQELMSDSGVGKHQHVIIGQGQIDSILSATAEDHRAVIEEAAGILKHRVRKDRALRRLERTDADVVRLHDLLGELARQMRPLKRQAAAAERHDGLVAEVQSLRLYLGGEELRTIMARRAEVAEAIATARNIVTERSEALSELGVTLEAVRRDAGLFGQALERDTAAAARLETTSERLRRIAQVAGERARTARERLVGAADRRNDLLAEMDQLESSLAATRAEEEQTRADAIEAERVFRALEDEERSLADQESMSTEGAIAVVRGDLRSLDAASERDHREVGSVDERLTKLSDRIEENRGEAQRLNDEIRELDTVVVETQDRYHRAQAARATAQSSWEDAESTHNEARVALASAHGRLEAVTEAAEGLADPESRALIEEASGFLGAIAARLDVPAEHAAAIDAILGSLADALVFDGIGDVEGAISVLKSAGRGGLSVVAGIGSDSDAPQPIGGLTWMPDLLGPDADRMLGRRLLGDAYLAEGWRAGWAAAQSHPHLRVATPEGDVFTGHSARIAHPDGTSPAMLENAQVELERAEIDVARSQSLLTQSRRAFDDARVTERDALETLESLEARLSGATDALGRIERMISEAETEIERLMQRKRSLRSAIDERADQRQILVTRLQSLEGEEAERQQAWEDLVARRTDVAARREKARASWQAISSEVMAVSERRAMMERRLEAIGELLAEEETHPVDPARIDRLEAIERAARQALDAAATHLEVLRSRQAELRVQAGEAGSRLDDLNRAHDEHRREIEDAERRISRLDVEAAELRVRMESVAERLRRDADATEDEALGAPRPEFEDDDLDALLRSREAELKRMGPINPLAASEYAELEERHSFLSGQLEDLESSRNELRKVITALDEEIHSQFMAAYSEIATAYEEHFGVLFPGGRGHLTLTDPDDPMMSGVEITAQPVGKKVSKMSLLSGGERSLAALAFLFAVFKARPSPFYLLDEVEAALDDANLRRFLRLLDAFRDNAQLMIITHQQQTMETGDVLYGVTMEPGGSSKVIAKSMSSVEQTV